MQLYNLMSCSGFGSDFMGGCSMGWLGLVMLFFIVAVLRKWGGEEVGIGFNFLFALIGGIIPYFILITLFGSFKIAFLVGLLLALVFGYGVGLFIGGDE